MTNWAEPSPLPPEPRPRQVIGEETLGWAIVGASAAAAHHIIPAIRSQPPLPAPDVSYPVSNARVVGVFSHDEGRARRFAEAHHIPHSFANLADLLARHDVDCVYAGSHPRHLAQATLAALAADKHVLCETPMALSLEDALAMAHTAAGRGLTLAVNCQRRVDAAIQAMLRLLLEGEIGDLLGGRVDNIQLLRPSLHTWRLRPHGGGIALDRTVHDIDLLRFLLRDEVQTVSALNTQHLLSDSVEEDVVAWVAMRRSGLLFQLHDSYILPHDVGGVTLYGSAGTLSARHVFVDDAPSELILIRHGRPVSVPLDDIDPYAETVARFHAAVRRQGQPVASPGDGIHNLAVALAVRESIQRGHRVSVEFPERPLDDRSRA